MLRVPGSIGDLFSIRASGADIRVVYSSLDAVKIAQENPGKQVVFFAIGFETTAPANAMSVIHAQNMGLENYSLLISQVRIPPAMHAILGSANNRIQGFLAAGHVCTVMGYWEYDPIAQKYKVPVIVTGFEPLDISQGILYTVRQLEKGSYTAENAYPRVVTYEGNQPAQKIIHQVFEDCDQTWRGIGKIQSSGWQLNHEYKKFDAAERFQVQSLKSAESPLCIAGQILQGLIKPVECPAFANQCTPEHPLGATMVSSEGTCAAYYRYGRSQ
jgi:hydrogenase expression/formation protein HypD